MRTRIVRVAEGKNSTLSHLYIDGVFQCFLLEDKIRKVKLDRHTAIPVGTYELSVNGWGAMNTKYKEKFAEHHQGMIEIDGMPNFSLVYIHIGNTISDTAGCPLCGLSYLKKDGEFQVVNSTDAYKMIYPKLLNIAKSRDNRIAIENDFQF